MYFIRQLSLNIYKIGKFMGLTDYLIPDVSQGEFKELKRNESSLHQRALETVNSAHKEAVSAIEMHLRYNPERRAVGIWIGPENSWKLALNTSRLNKDENTLVYAVYEEVQSGLHIIRGGLESEKWVDKIKDEEPLQEQSAREPDTDKKRKDDIPF
jgi:hypothetical protein